MDDLRDLLRRAAGDGPARFGSGDIGRRVRRRRTARRAGGAGAVTLLVAAAGVLVAVGMGGDTQVADEDGAVPSEAAFCAVLGADLLEREWGDTDLVVLLRSDAAGAPLDEVARVLADHPEVDSFSTHGGGEAYERFARGFEQDPSGEGPTAAEMMVLLGPEVRPPTVWIELVDGSDWDGGELVDHERVEEVVAIADLAADAAGELRLVDRAVRPFTSSAGFPLEGPGATIGVITPFDIRELVDELLAVAPPALRSDVAALDDALDGWEGGAIELTPRLQAAADRIVSFFDANCGGSESAFCDVLATDVVARQWGDTDVVVTLEPGADAETATEIAGEVRRLPGVAAAEPTPMSVARQRYLDLLESTVESSREVDDDDVPLTVEVELEPGVTGDLDAIDQLAGVHRAYSLDQRFPNGPRLVDVYLRPLALGNVGQWTGWRALATDVRPLVDAAPTGLAEEAGVVLGAVRESTTGPDDVRSDEVVRAARRIVAFHDTECVERHHG